MQRRRLLGTITAAGLGLAAGIGLWDSAAQGRPGPPPGRPRRPSPEPRKPTKRPTKKPTPTPPPGPVDPGYVPADRLKALANPIDSLRDLTPPAPAGAVALTIDDGPDPYWTPMVLDVLAEFGVPATFNLIGSQVPQNTWLIRRIVESGHQIANHTLTHPMNLPELSAQEIERQITEAGDRIAQASSVAPRFFRAPGGAWSQRIVETAAAHRMICVDWNVDPRDWARPGVPQITGTLQSARPGDILLVHDGGGDRSQTVEALRAALPALKQRGITFVAL